MQKVIVHNLIILDESGSMSSVFHPTINGFNSFIKNLKSTAAEFPDQEHKVSFVTFNTSGTKYIAENVDPSFVKELNTNDYSPDGGTPLLDAIGVTAKRLRQKTEYFKDIKVLVSIFTDGFENASTKFSGQDIRKLVAFLEEHGWTFTYIGTDHDVTKASQHLNIKNMMSYEKNQAGMNKMFEEELRSRKQFYKNLSEGKKDNSKGYFDKY